MAESNRTTIRREKMTPRMALWPEGYSSERQTQADGCLVREMAPGLAVSAYLRNYAPPSGPWGADFAQDGPIWRVWREGGGCGTHFVKHGHFSPALLGLE